MKKITSIAIIAIIMIIAVGTGVWMLPDSQPHIVLIRALSDSDDAVDYNHSYLASDGGDNIKWSGSGVFIRPDLILTAGHVVKDTQKFEIVLPNGKIRPGYFAYLEDPNLTDVGLVRVHGDYPISHFGHAPHLAQDVWIWGYGLAENPATLTRGIVSCIDRDTDFFGRINLLQVDAAAWPGHSGSPVLDKNNKIVGILIGGRNGRDNWSICVPVDIIKLSLAKYDAYVALEKLSN